MAKQTLDDLRARTHGQVIAAEDAGYDEARKVYNGMIDRRPLVIVRPANADDVSAVVSFARDDSLDLSVRGGAHNAPGFGTNDGGVVIDLSSMRGVRVDASARTARVEGGALLGDLDAATHEFGLATTGGIIASTGVGGLTLGGGSGYLNRALGLTIDNLLSADVVTADGKLVVASDKENEDLFWALRGGGGNFGVVTSFEFQLHPLSDVYVGAFFYSLDDAKTVLQFYRDYIKDAPEQLGLFPAFAVAPPLPFLPEDTHGKTWVAMIACWAGPLDDGEKQLAPIRDVAPRVGEMMSPMPYPMLQSLFDPLLPAGLQQYWKGSFSTELTDGAIEAHLEHGPKIPTMNSAMHIYSINGAPHRVPSDATAFAHREATFSTVIAAIDPDPANNEANKKWVRDYYAALEPHSDEGAGYINFMDGDDQSRIKANYKGNYERLAGIKKKYDAGNLFHMNQNIKPA